MSATTSDRMVMEVMQSIFQQGYVLDDDDKELLERMVKYGQTRDGLSKEEIGVFVERGFMNEPDHDFLVTNEFWFRGLVMPSFWLKCLLGYHGMMTFKATKNEN